MGFNSCVIQQVPGCTNKRHSKCSLEEELLKTGMANVHTVPCENTALGGLKTTTGAQKAAQSYLLKWYLSLLP